MKSSSASMEIRKVGCDIHAIFQRQVPGGWETISSPYDEWRQYRLFGILAGVRSMDTPIEPPRGLPSDFPTIGLEDYPCEIPHLSPHQRAYYNTYHKRLKWMGDHSYSWFLGSELLAFWKKLRAKIPDGQDQQDYKELLHICDYFFSIIQLLMKRHKEIRVVFGFDN